MDNTNLIKEFNFLTLMNSKAAGAISNSKSNDSKVGKEANKDLIGILKVAKNVAKQATVSVGLYHEALAKVQDQEVKNVITQERENYKNIVQAQQKKLYVNCIKNLTNAGLTKEEAITWASGIAITVGQELSGTPENQQ